MTAPQPRVAFVGLGAMGEPMAAHLCRHDVPVVVVKHRRSEAVDRLAALGAERADTPALAGARCDVAILMLPTSAEVEQVLFGPDGLAATMAPGRIVVDCGTSDPDATRAAATRLRGAGIGLVDAPVTRGVAGARAGKLAFFLGGDDQEIARVRPLLAFMGDEFHVMGPTGAGHVTKLVNNLISLGTAALVAEGLALGRRAGMDDEPLLQALLGGSAASSILRSHGRRILQGDVEPGFTIDLARKDLGLALELERKCAVPSFLGAAAKRIYDATAGTGNGGADIAAVRSCFGGAF